MKQRNDSGMDAGHVPVAPASASEDQVSNLVRVELPPVRVQGFDRLFRRLGEILK
jgi:hypothetical protein